MGVGAGPAELPGHITDPDVLPVQMIAESIF
jgi:hypothetical protein